MVNVTKDNFIEKSNDFLKHLPTAAFIAIDEEMTGISLPSSNHNNRNNNSFRARKDETPGQRYAAELKQIPERYSIIQCGISLFHSTATDPPVGVGVVAAAAGASSSAAAAAAAAAAAGASTGSNTGRPAPANSSSIEWKCRRYNFYMFPGNNNESSSSHGDVVLSPGAVHFLNQHNMSFDTWTKRGIHFCTETEACDILQQYVETTRQAKEQAAAEDDARPPPTLQDAYRPRVELQRTEDIDFFSRTMASLREWLDAALPLQHQHQHYNNHPGAPQPQQQQHLEGTSLLLPECSAFMRRALYESIQQEYPSLVLENAGSNSSIGPSAEGGQPQQQQGNRNQIRVWRLNEQEKLTRRLRLQRQAWENVILHKIGMTRIFAALSRVCCGLPIDRQSVLFAPSVDQVGCWDEEKVAAASFVPNDCSNEPSISSRTGSAGRKIPIIVHNGFMDLCFLMTHFCQQELPETLTECKALIRNHFPIVYDTKILSTESFARSASASNADPFLNMPINNTRLDGLFDRFGRHGGVRDKVQVVSSSATSYLYNEGNGNMYHAVGAARGAGDDDQEHEAAYDAYMTGVCFIGLIHDIQQGIQVPLPGSADYDQNDDGSDNNNDGNNNDNGDEEEKDNGSDDHGNVDDDDDDDEEEGELDVSTIESETQKLVRFILSNDKDRKHDVRVLFGRNKLFQFSMYTMDLEEPIRDPLARGMLAEAAFRISGFDPNVSTRDFVRLLFGLVDSQGRRINFEIIWIDDTTLIVATCWRPGPRSPTALAATVSAQALSAAAAALAPARDGRVAGAALAVANAASAAAADANRYRIMDDVEDCTAILREHGQLVLDTLTTRFPRDTIVNLKDDLDRLEAAEAAATANAKSDKDASAAFSWTSRFWGLFGLNKKRAAAATATAAAAEEKENGQHAKSNKRRRLR